MYIESENTQVTLVISINNRFSVERGSWCSQTVPYEERHALTVTLMTLRMLAISCKSVSCIQNGETSTSQNITQVDLM